MTYPPPFGATDHYAPATSLMEAWLQGSPMSLKAQEVALIAIAEQLRSIQADYQKTNENIARAYPAGAGALALLETAAKITVGMDHATGSLSGDSSSLSAIIGEAGSNLASTQTTTSAIKTVFDAVVQALESNPWTEWAAPGVAYVGTFAEIIPAAMQLMELYNAVSAIVDSMNPDAATSQLSASDAGQVGNGYQAGSTPGLVSDYQNSQNGFGQNGSGQNGFGQNSNPATTAWQDPNGQWHYPSSTTPWQDANGQWHAPTGGTSGNPATNAPTYNSGHAGTGSGAAGSGLSGSGAAGSGLSGSGAAGSGLSGSGVGSPSGTGSSGSSAAPVSLPNLSNGWQPIDSTSATAPGGGPTGSAGLDSGSGAVTGPHHPGEGVTVTITEGDAAMSVTTDRDGHFAGTLHGHEVDIDVDLVESPPTSIPGA